MPDATQASVVRRFGPFEINFQSGELRKNGMRLRLSGQPFQILAVLVERAGEVVTREELHSKLWQADTFVDFDHGLNNSVARIREVLDDSSETPRYVETIPRRGYRFIAPLADIPSLSVSPSAAEPTVPAHTITRPDASGPSLPPVERRFASSRLQVLLGGVALLAVFAVGLVLYRGRSAKGTREPAIKSLAVLPLKNLSGDPEQEYFVDGMTETLITELGKIRGLRVISRQSVMQYQGSKKPLQEIAHELNVDALLEGAVEHSRDGVRVIVRLDQVSPERQLWSNQYNRDIRDLLRLQDEIARAVTDEIQVKLNPQERARLASSRPVNPEAQDDYFRALQFRNKWEASYTSEQNLVTAINYFRQAVEKDSNYGLAYAGMACTYIALGNPQGANYAPKETLPLAKAAATRAVEVDPLLGEAHFALAQTLELYDWNWSEAERQYKLALELSPNFAPAHWEYGRFLQALGRNDEAMRQMANAAELNPMDLQTRLMVGIVTYAARQYDSAISQLKELDTSYPGIGDFGLGWCYREKKMYPEAIAALERCVARSGRAPLLLASLASVYGLAGRKHEAVKLIAELKESPRQHHVSASLLAEAYLGLGERDEAMAWLERAYEEHDQWMVYIKSYPGWDALSSEPRFQALVRRMNFP